MEVKRKIKKFFKNKIVRIVSLALIVLAIIFLITYNPKEDLKSMGILEMADSQSEALIKGLIQDLIPEGYKLKTEKQ